MYCTVNYCSDSVIVQGLHLENRNKKREHSQLGTRNMYVQNKPITLIIVNLWSVKKRARTGSHVRATSIIH